MENVKIDENRMVPDIRPENIETITETYTSSGGGEQTATYKILNVHPIINGILDKLAFFRTHAAAVWYNKLAGRTVADEIEDLKAKMTPMPFIKNLNLKANTLTEITSDKIPNNIIYFFGVYGTSTFLTGVGVTNTAGRVYLSPDVFVSYKYVPASGLWAFNPNADLSRFSVWT